MMQPTRSTPFSRAVTTLLLILASCTAQAQRSFEWTKASPQDHGLDPAKLDAWLNTLQSKHTDGLLLVRNDKVILEWYADGWSESRPHGTASLAKALIGGTSLILAMQDGRISPDDLASKYIPQWRTHPLKSRITIAHLATHSSGIQDAHIDGVPHEKLPGWMGEFWAKKPTDPFTVSRDQAPVIFEPGTKFHYSNPGMAMLSYAITASLRGTAHEDVRTLLRERVMRPIGVGDKEWSAGYGATYDVDGMKMVANWGGAAFTPRAAARVGRLMMRKGDWDGKRVLDAETIERVLLHDKSPQRDDGKEDPAPNPALAWWTNAHGNWKNVPRDAFGGAGAGNQVLLVIPSLDLIVVRNGQNLFDPKKGENFWSGAEKYLFDPLMASIQDAHKPIAAAPRIPLPPSPVIRTVEFDPPSTVKRDAIGSDNWPITWGRDGHLYTSYGDGRGFDPRVEKKLSMGFSRVEGDPANYRAVNLRSDSGERLGDGAKGPKVSGLISAGGTLYAWVRNTGNATLVWSDDLGKTWTWGWKLDRSFATPTFLNFGQDNAGARDEYVYTFSQDNESAYEPADGVVLARAHKDRLRDPAAWQFYAGDGRWTSDLSARKRVIDLPGLCERTDAVYNAPLKRYLMTMGFGHGQGWAVLDAPEPWGPWTVAWSTDAWDARETHGYRIPTKWISAHGREMWLVYSGRGEDDAFCLRKMRLILR